MSELHVKLFRYFDEISDPKKNEEKKCWETENQKRGSNSESHS